MSLRSSKQRSAIKVYAGSAIERRDASLLNGYRMDTRYTNVF